METTQKTHSKKESIIQAVKFALFSVSAGIIQTVVFTILTEVPQRLFDTQLSYWACYLPALIISVIYNFTLNRKFTFKSATNVPIAMLKVALFYAVFTPVSTILGNMAAEYFNADTNQIADYAIFAVTMLSNFVTEFLYDKYIVFREKKETNSEN